MNKKYLPTVVLSALVFLVCCAVTSDAARKPDIISYDAELLQNSIEVNVKWQSDCPVTRAEVTAGTKSNQIELDPYDDNIKDAYGYHGETSLVVPVDTLGFYEDFVTYVIQLEDDAGQRSRRVTGRLKVSSVTIPEREFGKKDALTREFIDRKSSGKKEGMIDQVLTVMERHDTPPVIDDITVNRLNTENVSFASQAIDDKGLKKITFKIFNSQGNMVQEQELSDMGTIWKGTTQTFSLESGTYTVLAQATDTAGNTSPEKSKEFTLSTEAGSLTVSINPEDAIVAGAQWRIDNGPWQKSGATVSGLATGTHVVEFNIIPVWSAPEKQNISVEAGKTLTTTGTYDTATGQVTDQPRSVERHRIHNKSGDN